MFILWLKPSDDPQADMVQDIACGGKPDDGQDWQEVPDDWHGTQGDKRKWFEADMRSIPDHDLVTQGKRTDNRGRVYNTENRSETRDINEYDQDVPEGYTQESPIPDEAYQKFDKAKNKWVVETEKKELAEKEAELAEVQSEIEEAEQKTIRHLRAMKQGREDDSTKFNEYDSLIENTLRPKHKQLETEIDELKAKIPA